MRSSGKPGIWKQQRVQTTAHSKLGSGGEMAHHGGWWTTHPKNMIYFLWSQGKYFNFIEVESKLCIFPTSFSSITLRRLSEIWFDSPKANKKYSRPLQISDCMNMDISVLMLLYWVYESRAPFKQRCSDETYCQGFFNCSCLQQSERNPCCPFQHSQSRGF